MKTIIEFALGQNLKHLSKHEQSIVVTAHKVAWFVAVAAFLSVVAVDWMVG